MKNILIIFALLVSIHCLGQQKDTVVIKLSEFQKKQLDEIDKKKKEITEALEKQKTDLFAQLDERANLIVLLLLDSKDIKQEEVDNLQYKDGSLLVTKKKKKP